MRIAVFASGNGSNFQALADYLSKKEWKLRLIGCFVISLQHMF